jgi:hypothetical protein
VGVEHQVTNSKEGDLDCPKASHHTEYAHVDLGDEAWAHLKRKLRNDEAEQIEVAMLAANYETAGAAKMTLALVQAALSSAPDEWRNGYTEPDGTQHEGQYDGTVAVVARFLDQYETDHELALMQPKARQAMAEATFHLLDTYARVFLVESSVGEWPLTDGQHARIVKRKAQTLWSAWNREMNDRLKAAGSDSD